jgi:periplasmic protein TonB
MTIRLEFVVVTFILLLFLCPVFSQAPNVSGTDCVPPTMIGPHYGPQSRYTLKDGAAAIVSIRIDKKGRVLDPQLLRSSGNKDYDRDALNSVRGWQFKPSTCKGKPIEVRFEITMKWDPPQSSEH